MYQGQDSQGSAYWSFACSNGHDYQVRIDPDSKGSTRYLECAVLQAVGSHCWETFQSKSRALSSPLRSPILHGRVAEPLRPFLWTQP